VRVLREEWHDASLTALLLVQALVVFVLSPARAAGIPVPGSAVVVVLLAFMSLVIVMGRGRWTLAVGVGTLLLNLLSLLASRLWGGVLTELGGDAEGLLTFGVLAVVVFRAVFRPGRFNNHRVRGAIVFYLNLGLLFAILHRLVAEFVPGAYAHLPSPHDEPAFRAATTYLSFITLTSVGYGDVVPVSPLARSLCMLEATLGQLLPTVLIARVVVLAMHAKADE
jgi:voltage-gated potassium channel Kch